MTARVRGRSDGQGEERRYDGRYGARKLEIFIAASFPFYVANHATVTGVSFNVP